MNKETKIKLICNDCGKEIHKHPLIDVFNKDTMKFEKYCYICRKFFLE